MLNENEKKQLEELLYKMSSKELSDCKDRMDRIKELSLEGFTAGNMIQFGFYPSGYTDDEVSRIPWRILTIDEKEGKALLLSEYAIDSLPYHPVPDSVCFESCSLNRWLNSVFIATAFNEDERRKILSPGVLILSEEELEKYVPEDLYPCTASIWAILRPIAHFIDSTKCSYWLRTDEKSAVTSVVSPMGQVVHNKKVNSQRIGIRPAVWVNIG